MRDEVLSNVGTQKMNTCGSEVSDREGKEFHWKGPDLKVYTVFLSSVDNPFFLTTFNIFDMNYVAK